MQNMKHADPGIFVSGVQAQRTGKKTSDNIFFYFENYNSFGKRFHRGSNIFEWGGQLFPGEGGPNANFYRNL